MKTNFSVFKSLKSGVSITYLITLTFLISSQPTFSQDNVVDQIIEEATENSQLEVLAHELFDVIGPRLSGSPHMIKANDWSVEKFISWGIPARKEQWGEWLGWERGITHVDLISPRVVSLNAMQLAYSPDTPKKGVTADLITIPNFADSLAFEKWLPQVSGKFVLLSHLEPSGRSDDNWKKWATDESYEKYQALRKEVVAEHRENIRKTGYTMRTLPAVLEEAGAVGIIASNWSQGFGANKIFRAYTKKVPTIDMSLEDYGMLYRMVEYGDAPQIKVVAQSEFTGTAPAFNTIAEIKGSEKPDEYVILSAHFDSWDGGTGATDNGTGSILMMETIRVLKQIYPNPKRTILVGLWGSEEQGLHGSRAFVEDHPEILPGIQTVINQDNGTGRAFKIGGQGFLHSYDYIGRWLQKVPGAYKDEIETTFPGSPGGGGSDHAPFVAAGAPTFNLFGKQWDYGTYTWHTNLDTYDKVVFDDVRNNVILAAILTYMACEDPEKTARDKVVLPMNEKTGERKKWPSAKSPNRRGYLED